MSTNILETSERTRVSLKLLGYAFVVVGLLLGFLNYFGAFKNKRKLSFAETIMSRVEKIPRTTPGFELFIRAFPPPQRVSEAQVSAIADRILRVNSSSEVGTTVRYIVGGETTTTVARFDQVNEWARSTHYPLLSLIIGSIGALLALPVHIHDYKRSKKDA
jgi:hypothetical protein